MSGERETIKLCNEEGSQAIFDKENSEIIKITKGNGNEFLLSISIEVALDLNISRINIMRE